MQGRGLVSYVHIWWGRILMVLGVVNGGLGLQLAQESNGPVIAYAVIAAVVFVVYAGFKAWSYFWLGTGTAVDAQKNETTPVRRAGDESL